jgi:hypothetical protein
MNIKQKLLAIQSELKAPKSQYNTFGKYSFRSSEDITEAVKPLCVKYKALLTVTDSVVLTGERYYIQATAVLEDLESDGFKQVTAFAREEDSKKGMDASQVSGATSSYARKYALNGLFAIDDTKDADSQDNREQPKPKAKPLQTAAAGKPASSAVELAKTWDINNIKIAARKVTGLSDDAELVAWIEETLEWPLAKLPKAKVPAAIDKIKAGKQLMMSEDEVSGAGDDEAYQ